jgi:hypothetical protein
MTRMSIAIRESIWVYPILDVLHCVGILLVAGTIVVVDLRLLGLGLRQSTVSSVVQQVLPWTLSGFVFMAVTGSLLAWSEPLRLYPSVFFRWKLLFLAISLTPTRARFAAIVSIVCWIGVIAAGRAVGYEVT